MLGNIFDTLGDSYISYIGHKNLNAYAEKT